MRKSLLESAPVYKLSLNVVPKRLIMYSALVCVFIYGFGALHMDFEKYDFRVPDSFYMLPVKFWIFIGASNVLLGIFFVKLRSEFFNAIVITAAYIFIIFPLAQWPVVMGIDQFLHTSTAKLSDRNLSIFGSEIVNDVYLDYPATSILQLTFKNLTGLDYILGATILAALIKAISIFLIYLVCTRVFDKKISCLVVLLFLVANFRFNDYYQFAPQALAFSLVLLLLYLYLRLRENRRFAVMLFVTYSTLVLTHPYASFFGLMTLVSLFLIRKGLRKEGLPRISGTLVLFALAFWVFWQVYPALGSFNARSPSALETMTDFSQIQTMLEEARTVGRSIVNPILLSYQMIVQIFLATSAIVAAIVLRKRAPKIFIALLGGLIFLTIQLILTSDPPRVITLDKVIYFGMLPAAALTIYLITYVFRKSVVANIVIGLGLVALIPLSFLASNQYVYMDSVKGWEIDAVIFAINHLGKEYEKTAVMDSVTSKVYTYYSYDVGDVKPFVKGYYLHRNVDNPTDLEIKADLVLMSFREKVDWYYHQGTPTENWDILEQSYVSDAQYDKIYDNDSIHIYLKKH